MTAGVKPTAACVAGVLLKAGLPAAPMDDHGYRAIGDGFAAVELPVAGYRVGVHRDMTGIATVTTVALLWSRIVDPALAKG